MDPKYSILMKELFRDLCRVSVWLLFDLESLRYHFNDSV